MTPDLIRLVRLIAYLTTCVNNGGFMSALKKSEPRCSPAAKPILAVATHRALPITPKKCGCGRVHFEIPATARVQKQGDRLSGWYWDCACHSTLFIPLTPVREGKGRAA